MIRSKILREAVAHWNSDFTGITGLELAERTGMPHRRVLSILRGLEQRGLGRCRPEGPGEGLALVPMDDGRFEARREPTPATVIFFPDGKVLRHEFRRAGVDHGRYANLLHLGKSQVALCYFRLDVLGKYRDQQERYHFDDSVSGGWIAIRDQYYLSLPDGTRDAQTFGRVRYGRRRLKNGDIAVAAILWDLAALPREEQKYWESHELRGVEFAAEDPDFNNFVQHAYEGQFVDDDDPLRRVYGGVADINSMLAPHKLFNNDRQNPHLRYPTLNNRKSYSAAHKELWKLIGTDSLNKRLIEQFIASRNLPVSTSDGEGTLSKLRRILASLHAGVVEDLLSPFETCRDARIEDAHKLDPLELPAGNYIDRFRQDCVALADALKSILALLAASALGREVANG